MPDPPYGRPRRLPAARPCTPASWPLATADDTQRALHAQALQIAGELARVRLLLIAQHESTAVSGVFLVILVFWLVVLFLSFGLFAPRNATVLATLLISALSVSGAVFLILELDQPFEGPIRIPSAPLRSAFAGLGEQRGRGRTSCELGRVSFAPLPPRAHSRRRQSTTRWRIWPPGEMT